MEKSKEIKANVIYLIGGHTSIIREVQPTYVTYTAMKVSRLNDAKFVCCDIY